MKLKILRQIHQFVYWLAQMNPNDDQLKTFNLTFNKTSDVPDSALGASISKMIEWIEENT